MTNELVDGVTYIAYHTPKVIEISPDNGQGITERVGFCTCWECQRWDGEHPIAPALVTNDKGFRICSACGSSYGR